MFTDMNAEIWKDIVGYKGYQVSSLGNVVSLWRRIGHEWKIVQDRPKILRHAIAKKGYHMVRLQLKPGYQKLVTVHKLMLEAFVGPRPNPKYHGCHIDDNKNNNALDNLEWNTGHKNLQARFRNNGGEKLEKNDIQTIRRLRNLGMSQHTIANRLGVTQGHVSRILNGQQWHYV